MIFPQVVRTMGATSTGPVRNMSSFPKAGVSIPIIEECVRDISPTSLMDLVTHLSSYHSRLSTSGGALDAEAWITSEMIRFGMFINH